MISKFRAGIREFLHRFAGQVSAPLFLKEFFRSLRRDDAHEFKPTLAEIEERPSHPMGRIIFWVIIIAIVFFSLWMCLGKVDVVVSGRGLVIPEGDIKVLQPLDTGVVIAIHCREGDFVRKGQVLMEIDPSITAPELESKQKTLQFVELEKERLNATLGNGRFMPDREKHDGESIRVQQELYMAQRVSLKKQIEAKEAELMRVEEESKAAEKERRHSHALFDIASDRVKRLGAVIDIISKVEYEKAHTEVLTCRNAVEQSRGRIEQLAHQKRQIISELSFIRENFNAATLKEYSEKQKQSTELKAQIDKTSFVKDKQRIVSPVDGHIANLYVHTVGGVVTPAQKVMSVVPRGAPLIVKANILSKDIGFVREGMNVSMKIDTFDFQKYGILKGTVRNVSKHSIEHEKLGTIYEVYVNPQERELRVEGRMIAISSGMSLTTEIKIKKRRIIEFFIYPLIKYFDEGIKVR